MGIVNQWYKPKKYMETEQSSMVLTLNPAEKAGLARLTIFTAHAKSVIVKTESH